MKLRQFFLCIILSISPFTFIKAENIEDGKALFNSRCAACHTVNKALTGPALANIGEKRSIDWIISFVKSSASMIKSGDTAAVAVYEQFNKIPMPDHPDLTDENVKNIVAYIQSTSKADEANSQPFAAPSELKKPYTPLSFKEDYLFFIAYLGAVAILGLVLYMAVKLKSTGYKVH